MRAGLGVSLAAHVVILAYGIFGLPNAESYQVEMPEALPVELVEIADETDLKLGEKTAKVAPEEVPQPKAEAPAPAPDPKPVEKPAETPVEAARPPSPRPEPEPVPEPAAPDEPEQVAALPPAEPPPPAEVDPEPAPEQPAEVAPAPAPTKPRARPKPPKQLAQPKPEPKTEAAKPAPAKPSEAEESFSTDDIAALLDKRAPSGGGDPEPAQSPQTVGTSTGRVDAAMTQSWVAALSARLAACWAVPTGVREAQTLRVKIGFSLLPDGSVTGMPMILEVNGVSNPLSQVAAEAAQRAVMQCGPYGDIFPVEHYALWQSIQVIFDPREMFGSG